MRIYKISKSCFKTKIQNADASSPAWFMDFDGTKHFLSDWKVPHFTKTAGNENEPLEDLVYVNPLILSRRVIDALDPLVSTQGEVLPISIDEGKYCILNCVNQIDALDESLCIRRPAYDGAEEMLYHRYMFNADKVKGNHFFTIVNDSTIDAYVDDEVKKIIEKNNFTGFRFNLVWGDDLNYAALDAKKTALKNRESYYLNVADISNETKEKMRTELEYIEKIIKNSWKVEFYAYCIIKEGIVCAETRKLPNGIRNVDSFRYYAAISFGNEICYYNRWRWVEVYDGTDTKMAIASEDDSYVFFIFDYMQNLIERKIMDEEELKNMWERICRLKPGEKKFIPIN